MIFSPVDAVTYKSSRTTSNCAFITKVDLQRISIRASGSLRVVKVRVVQLEQIQRKSRVRGSTPENAPRIRAGMEKKEQKPELKTKGTRRCYVEKTSIFLFTGPYSPINGDAGEQRSVHR